MAVFSAAASTPATRPSRRASSADRRRVRCGVAAGTGTAATDRHRAWRKAGAGQGGAAGPPGFARPDTECRVWQIRGREFHGAFASAGRPPRTCRADWRWRRCSACPGRQAMPPSPPPRGSVLRPMPRSRASGMQVWAGRRALSRTIATETARSSPAATALASSGVRTIRVGRMSSSPSAASAREMRCSSPSDSRRRASRAVTSTDFRRGFRVVEVQKGEWFGGHGCS